jgi:hypothetical protein
LLLQKQSTLPVCDLTGAGALQGDDAGRTPGNPSRSSKYSDVLFRNNSNRRKSVAIV